MCSLFTVFLTCSSPKSCHNVLLRAGGTELLSSDLDVVIKQDMQLKRRKPVFGSGMLMCFYTKIVGSRSMFVHIYIDRYRYTYTHT